MFFHDLEVEVSYQPQAFDVYYKNKPPLVNSSPSLVVEEGILLLIMCSLYSTVLHVGGMPPHPPNSHLLIPPLCDSRPPAPVFVTPL